MKGAQAEGMEFSIKGRGQSNCMQIMSFPEISPTFSENFPLHMTTFCQYFVSICDLREERTRHPTVSEGFGAPLCRRTGRYEASGFAVRVGWGLGQTLQ